MSKIRYDFFRFWNFFAKIVYFKDTFDTIFSIDYSEAWGWKYALSITLLIH